MLRRGADALRRNGAPALVLMSQGRDQARAVLVGQATHGIGDLLGRRSIVQAGEQVAVHIDKRYHAFLLPCFEFFSSPSRVCSAVIAALASRDSQLPRTRFRERVRADPGRPAPGSSWFPVP